MGEERKVNDTVGILKECDSGTKMGINAIDEVLDKVGDAQLKALLVESREHHEKLGNDIQVKLAEHRQESQEPAPIAKGMAWMKTNVKLTLHESDNTIADLITDGCDMGIKSLHRYMNQYDCADNESKSLCRKLIDIEEVLRKDLQKYL